MTAKPYVSQVAGVQGRPIGKIQGGSYHQVIICLFTLLHYKKNDRVHRHKFSYMFMGIVV